MNIKFNNVESIYQFCAMADQYDTDIDLMSGRYLVDAKSIVGIFSLALDKPVQIVIHDDSVVDEIKEKMSALNITIME